MNNNNNHEKIIQRKEKGRKMELLYLLPKYLPGYIRYNMYILLVIGRLFDWTFIEVASLLSTYFWFAPRYRLIPFRYGKLRSSGSNNWTDYTENLLIQRKMYKLDT